MGALGVSPTTVTSCPCGADAVHPPGTNPWSVYAAGGADEDGELEVRQATFGHLGLVSFYVDGSNELLRIFDVT